MMKFLSHRSRRFASLVASGGALMLSAWLATIPGQAEESPLEQVDSARKPITCTDAAGIIYERGTPGFERCLTEMNQAAQEQAARAAESEKPKKLRKRKKERIHAPETTATPSPESPKTE